MNLKVTTGVSEEDQESGFMNATLSKIKKNTAISIAVELPEGFLDDIDCTNENEVRKKISSIFGDALAQGCYIEVQIGNIEDPEES